MHDLAIGRIRDGLEMPHYRILVDRLWPRGVSKEMAPWDTWNGEVAPSTDLRKWFGHDPHRFGAFRVCYLKELEEGRGHDAIQEILHRVEKEPVMLLTATKIVEISHLPVLRDYLLSVAKE